MTRLRWLKKRIFNNNKGWKLPLYEWSLTGHLVWPRFYGPPNQRDNARGGVLWEEESATAQSSNDRP